MFGYTWFDAHEGEFIVPLPASVAEESSNTGLAKLITLCSSDPVQSFLLLKRSSEDDGDHYIGDALPFLGYDFKIGTVSEIVATRATKRPKMGGSVVLDVPGREIAWLRLAFCTSIRNSDLEWNSLNVDANEEESFGDDDVPDTDYLDLILQRCEGWTKETSAADPSTMRAWESLKAELTRAQILIPTTMENVLYLVR